MPRVPLARPEPHDSLLAVDPAMPRDPQLRKIADDVLAQLKFAIANAADDDTDAPGEFDVLARELMATRSAPQREHARAQARALLAMPVAARTAHFGRLAAMDRAQYRRAGSHAVLSSLKPLDADGPALKAEFARSVARLVKPIAAPNPDVVAGAAYKTMKLFIRRVRCLDETNDSGDSDEILLGGTATDPQGKTVKIKQFLVDDDFDKGEVVNYGFSRVFHTWNLATTPGGFPYVYSAVLAMGERDRGGFGDFITKLWEKVGETVTKAIAGVVGAGIGAAIGSAIPGLGTVIGAVIGALLGWLISLFNNPDDIVGTRVVTMTLGAATKSYYDWAKLTSPSGWTTSLTFKGDDGLYKVDIAYRVFT